MWNNAGPAAILGVVPFIQRLSRKQIQLTGKGKDFGLTTTWSGVRPVMNGKYLEPLAQSTYVSARPYLEYPPPKTWYKKLGGNITIGPAPSLGLNFTQSEQQPRNYDWWYEVRLVNAWFKNFCSEKKETGFLRIWDTYCIDLLYSPNELVHIINNFKRKLGII